MFRRPSLNAVLLTTSSQIASIFDDNYALQRIRNAIDAADIESARTDDESLLQPTSHRISSIYPSSPRLESPAGEVPISELENYQSSRPIFRQFVLGFRRFLAAEGAARQLSSQGITDDISVGKMVRSYVTLPVFSDV